MTYQDRANNTYFTNPADAIDEYQKKSAEIKGIQGYLTDTGILVWSCKEPVKQCSLEKARTVESWWQDEWTIPGGIFNAMNDPVR